MKIIIAGGSGFIGQGLSNFFAAENEVVILSRQKSHTHNNTFHYSILSAETLRNIRFVKWNGRDAGAWSRELEGAAIIVNLAGRSVNCRYNTKNKKEIFNSRTDATEAIGRAIRNCSKPPKLWINASSATVYRHAEDRSQDEYTGEYHNDFSPQVVKKWEKTFFDERTPFTRKVALRMAIALGPGGVMIPYFRLLKFGLGGKQGSGEQMYSWVHVEDIYRTIEWIFTHPELEGIYNCTSPNPVNNETFMKVLRTATGTAFGLSAFKWMLKIGAVLIGTETELILKSRWVVPTRLKESGFEFKYPLLEDALENIVSITPRRMYHLF